MIVDLSVVIVTYNSAAFLPRCLESLSRATRRVKFEVIVVDNHSQDDTAAVLDGYADVQTLVNDENLGFARAANRGFRQAKGRHYLLLNPDTEVHDGALDRCVSFLDSNPEVGIVGARVNNPDGTLQRACRRSIPTPKIAFFRLSGLGKIWRSHPAASAYNLEDADPDETLDVEAVSGSFLMVRREATGHVGGLDERYFLYGEDLDFCLSISRLGYRIVYYPEAVVTHHKGASSRQARRASNREFHLAMKLFHNKHFAAKTPGWLNSLILGGIAARGTVIDIALLTGLQSHVGSKG